MAGETQKLQDEVTTLRREVAARERELERYAADLRETVKREGERAEELRRSYVDTVRALCNAVEARDAYTGRHAERVAAYSLAIAEASEVELANAAEIEFGFLLHDIGKVAVPDAILYKPGPLTEDERRLMERHVIVGWEILADIEFLGQAKEVVRSHHERWDGTGYPDGLKGQAIPFAARIFAVADTLDALTTTRPYRGAVTLARAREIITAAAASQFDPEFVRGLALVGDAELERIRSEGGA